MVKDGYIPTDLVRRKGYEIRVAELSAKEGAEGEKELRFIVPVNACVSSKIDARTSKIDKGYQEGEASNASNPENLEKKRTKKEEKDPEEAYDPFANDSMTYVEVGHNRLRRDRATHISAKDWGLVDGKERFMGALVTGMLYRSILSRQFLTPLAPVTVRALRHSNTQIDCLLGVATPSEQYRALMRIFAMHNDSTCFGELDDIMDGQGRKRLLKQLQLKDSWNITIKSACEDSFTKWFATIRTKLKDAGALVLLPSDPANDDTSSDTNTKIRYKKNHYWASWTKTWYSNYEKGIYDCTAPDEPTKVVGLMEIQLQAYGSTFTDIQFDKLKDIIKQAEKAVASGATGRIRFSSDNFTNEQASSREERVAEVTDPVVVSEQLDDSHATREPDSGLSVIHQDNLSDATVVEEARDRDSPAIAARSEEHLGDDMVIEGVVDPVIVGEDAGNADVSGGTDDDQ